MCADFHKERVVPRLLGCVLISLARQAQQLGLASIVRLLCREQDCPNPLRILVLRSSRLGDFICAMPALNRLRQAYPGARILLFTLPSASRAMRGKEGSAEWLRLLMPGVVDDVVLFQGEDLFKWSALKNLRQRVTDFDPEVTFILPFSQETVLSRLKKIVFLRGLGVKRNLYGWKLRAQIKRIWQEARSFHQVLGPLDALAEGGIRTDLAKDVSFQITVDPRAKASAERLWHEYGLTGSTVVAVFPGGTFEHKRWPVENFEALCQTLLHEFSVKIVLLGGKGEEPLAEPLGSLDNQKVHNWVGRTTLLETAEVLRRCSLFVGNDSGVAHLASAVGTPTVTIFSGIEFPGTWEPWDSRELAVRISVPCQGCLSRTFCPTGTMACTKKIEVSQVLSTCAPILRRLACEQQEPCLKSLL